MTNQWIDIAISLCNGMPSWPNDPPVHIDRITDVARDDEATVSRLTLGSHTGKAWYLWVSRMARVRCVWCTIPL